MTYILILTGSSRCLNYVKTMGMILGINVNFKIFFLISVTYAVGTHSNCLYVHTTYVFSINELFTISFLKQILNFFYCFSEMS